MERTEMRRRRAPAGGRGARGRNRPAMEPKERRRLAQLGASIGLFLLVFAGRGIFPARTSEWKALLGQNTDFGAVFTSLGAAISDGEPVWEALSGLWVDVFQREPVEEPPAAEPSSRLPKELFMETPGFRPDRMEDTVSTWCRTRRERIAAASALAGEQSVEAGAFGGEAEQTAQTGEDILMARTAVAVQPPQPVTAVAQTADGEGRELPASVSTEFYYLGLKETVTPVSAVLTSDYGYRDHPVSGNWSFHRGVDLGAPAGADILAFADGTVAYTGQDGVCGLYLKIDHENGTSTFYCHCSSIEVADGQTVTAGQTVAKVGETGNATGPHLHFALLKDGVYLDPLYYIEVG